MFIINKNIQITPLPQVNTKVEKIMALQPVLEALHLPAYNFFSNNNPVIAVEGIYDK